MVKVSYLLKCLFRNVKKILQNLLTNLSIQRSRTSKSPEKGGSKRSRFSHSPESEKQKKVGNFYFI